MRLDVVRYVLKTSPLSILADVREYGETAAAYCTG